MVSNLKEPKKLAQQLYEAIRLKINEIFGTNRELQGETEAVLIIRYSTSCGFTKTLVGEINIERILESFDIIQDQLVNMAQRGELKQVA